MRLAALVLPRREGPTAAQADSLLGINFRSCAFSAGWVFVWSIPPPSVSPSEAPAFEGMRGLSISGSGGPVGLASSLKTHCASTALLGVVSQSKSAELFTFAPSAGVAISIGFVSQSPSQLARDRLLLRGWIRQALRESRSLSSSRCEPHIPLQQVSRSRVMSERQLTREPILNRPMYHGVRAASDARRSSGMPTMSGRNGRRDDDQAHCNRAGADCV